MDNQINDLQKLMNDYLVKIHSDKSIIYGGLDLFYNLTCTLEKELSEHFDLPYEPIDYTKIAKSTSDENFSLIKNFYEKIGVDFDFDKSINDGTINFLYYDYFNDNKDSDTVAFHHTFYGDSGYINSKKIINIPNTGLITDALVAVHEISHLKNQPDSMRNQISDLLTESLAFAEEFIFMDYLSEIGYKEEMKLWQKNIFDYFYRMARDTRPIYKLFLLQKKALGDISKEDYEYYFKNESDYDDIIKSTSNALKNESFNFYGKSWYLMGAVLGTFMYAEYKKDNNFSKKILELNNKINTSSLVDCFNTVGVELEDFAKKDNLKFLKSFEVIKMNLNEIDPKNPTTKSNDLSK